MRQIVLYVASLRFILLWLSFVLCTGCSMHHHPMSFENNTTTENEDPLEQWNRNTDRLNDAIDRVVVKPVLTLYQTITPTFLQTSVTHFFNNLGTPLILINNILQGKWRLFQENSVRFLLNTTFGVLGLGDVASAAGLHHKPTSFSETLQYYGAGTGAYIVLPILGPTCLRYMISLGLDGLLYPPYRKHYITVPLYFEKRRQYDYDFSTELDPYTAKRLLFMQAQNVTPE